jgi:hypothetical protein
VNVFELLLVINIFSSFGVPRPMDTTNLFKEPDGKVEPSVTSNELDELEILALKDCATTAPANSLLSILLLSQL